MNSEVAVLEKLKPENLRSHYELSRLLAGMSADVAKLYLRWIAKLATHPGAPVKTGAGLAADCLDISEDVLRRVAGQDVGKGKLNGDRRFASEAWEKHASFRVLRQVYEACGRAALRLAEETPDMDPEDRRKLRFFTVQFLDAIAPANFAISNPEVLEETVQSRGRNFMHGMRNLWHDLDLKHGKLNISMSDLGAFEVGKNLATTPGEVVYRNDIMELLQYTPTTKQVSRRPLLIIPPWFNKFYVLDMQPANSVVKYLVDQGQTVFLISWRNPDEEMPDKSFDDYMLEGPLEALDVIEEITGESDVNAMGYCLGGILLACLLAWLDAKGRNPIRSATYLTTLIDYSDVGDVKVFVDEKQLNRLERLGRAKGYLPGDNVAWGFRLLRAPDLIWSFVINHYMLGRDRMPFDLLFWNEDTTNMPLSCHMYFMRNMYIDNKLRQPNAIELAGEPIDVTRIQTPAYILSTRDDHIAPWKTTYEATQLFSGKCRFVLGNSGHIAGVINPPTRVKYGYRVGAGNPPDAEDWFKRAKERPGSWWPDWVQWLRRYSGGKVAARKPGSKAYPSLEPAPGHYVRKMIRPEKRPLF